MDYVLGGTQSLTVTPEARSAEDTETRLGGPGPIQRREVTPEARSAEDTETSRRGCPRRPARRLPQRHDPRRILKLLLLLVQVQAVAVTPEARSAEDTETVMALAIER